MHHILLLLYIATVWYNMDPRIPCSDSEWFSTLQLVPPALEVLEEIITTIVCNAICPLIYRVQLSHNAI